MSSLVPETGFAQGASGPAGVYDTSPTGLGLSPAYLAPGASATASGFTGTLPSGSILAYGGATAPAGYVLCDGSTYDGTTTTYSNLWAALGTTYGGSGQSAFNVPDLQGRVPVGKGPNADVSALGNSDGGAAANRRPKHRTTNALSLSPGSIQVWQSTGGGQQPIGSGISTYQLVTPSIGGSIGSNNANDPLDASPYLVINYIIAL